MSVKCGTVIAAIERLAPRELAAGWDNAGLLVGDPGQEVGAILVALDVSAEVAGEAAATGVDMIVAHHPVIFKGLTALRTDRPEGRTLATLLTAGVAVYAAHTSLDVAHGGVNDSLAVRLGLSRVRPLAVERREKLLKLAVFVPESHAAAVREAIAAAGAGHIGNYSHCTFQTSGTGTFLPLAGTSPFIGRQGELECVPEVRMETILPEKLGPQVVEALLKAHPYEEVAYDLYPLTNSGPAAGLGRVGELPAPEAFGAFAGRVKSALGLKDIRVAGPTDRVVRTVAVCGGSGAGLLIEAGQAGADVLVTGDVKYHEALEAAAAGLTIIDAGHYATERPVVDDLAVYLRNCAESDGWGVTVKIDENSRDVFRVW